MISPDEVADSLRAHLHSRGYGPQPGATGIEIAAFESRHSVRMPADLREFFLRVNGTTEFADFLLTRFWPLEEVSPIIPSTSAGQSIRYFVFADQMIFAPDFAISLDDPSAKVVRYWDGFSRIEPVCSSFAEFVEIFMRDPWDVHVDSAAPS